MKSFLISALCLASFSSFASLYDGSWKSQAAKVTFSTEDISENYKACDFKVEISSQDLQNGFEKLSINSMKVNCSGEDSWPFSETANFTFVINKRTNEVLLESGAHAGQIDSKGAMVTQYEEDGNTYFVDLSMAGEKLNLGWYQRSFEDTNFDVVVTAQKN